MRHPEWRIFVLPLFHGVGDIGCLLALPLNVHDDWQVPAMTDGIHRRKEEEFVATQQVLDVVLRRNQKHIQSGIIHQAVQMIKIIIQIGHVSLRSVHWLG